MNAMDTTSKLIAALDREEVARARGENVDEKFHAGFKLFQRAVSLMEIGLRREHPDADTEEIARLLRERLEVTRGATVAP